MPKADKVSPGDPVPSLTPEEFTEAKRRFDAYLELAIQIWARIEHDPVAYAEMLRTLDEQRKKETP